MVIDLRLGDCLDVMPTLEAQLFDAIIADIPYGTTACKWDTVIPFAPMWENLKRLAKPKAAIVLFGSQPFTSALVMSNVEMFKYELIWDKFQTGAPGVAKFRPLPCHENILLFSSGSTTYNPIMTAGMPYKSTTRNGGNSHGFGFKGKFYRSDNKGVRFPLSITRVKKERHVVHATTKPVALMEYLIRTYTNEGDAVLDFTMGSGTTMVACVNTKRNGTGIEKDAGYFAIAERRVKEAQAQMSMPMVTPCPS